MTAGAMAVVCLAGIAALGPLRTASAPPPLRVCSDPNNLPFSNERGEGFENVLAARLADDLGTTVAYTWWPQRRGFLRNTLNAGVCDVVMGYPAAAEMVETTTPYYRSTYVFVTRRDRRLRVASLDDPQLRQMRIGVPLVGDDGATSPPAHALSRRGIVTNLVGYSLYGDYSRESPTAEIVDAVARGDVDVAAVWGPIGGYFAARSREPLDVAPVVPSQEGPVAQSFAIAMAVRRGDDARREQLNQFIRRRATEIEALLARYGVPRVNP